MARASHFLFFDWLCRSAPFRSTSPIFTLQFHLAVLCRSACHVSLIDFVDLCPFLSFTMARSEPKTIVSQWDAAARRGAQAMLQKKPGAAKKTSKWAAKLKELRTWLRKHRNEHPLQNHKDGHQLARWINNQRSLHAKRKLPQQRQALSEQFPRWTWSAWYAGFTALQTWLAEQPQVQRKLHAVPQYPQRTSASVPERKLAF